MRTIYQLEHSGVIGFYATLCQAVKALEHLKRKGIDAVLTVIKA